MRTHAQIKKYIENLVLSNIESKDYWLTLAFSLHYNEVLIDYVYIGFRPISDGDIIIYVNTNSSPDKHLERNDVNEHIFHLLRLEAVTLRFIKNN